MVTNKPGCYFDIRRDMDYPCFCSSCLIGKTAAQMSKTDTRYCLECYNSLNGDQKQRTETIDHWSECGQIFFHYGKGYGLTEDLKSICLGREEDILKAFETGITNGNHTPLQREVISGIIEKEDGFGQSNTGAKGMERAGTWRTAGHRKKNTRQVKKRRQLSLR